MRGKDFERLAYDAFYRDSDVAIETFFKVTVKGKRMTDLDYVFMDSGDAGNFLVDNSTFISEVKRIANFNPTVDDEEDYFFDESEEAAREYQFFLDNYEDIKQKTIDAFKKQGLIECKRRDKVITFPENVTIDLGDREVILEKGDRVRVLSSKKTNEELLGLEPYYPHEIEPHRDNRDYKILPQPNAEQDGNWFAVDNAGELMSYYDVIMWYQRNGVDDIEENITIRKDGLYELDTLIGIPVR